MVTNVLWFRKYNQLMMLYYRTKSGCKLTRSLPHTTERIICWLDKPFLWPWHWTQWTNFSEWHSRLRCCIIIPCLATKCSVVQNILSGQTFTNILNLGCDLDLQCGNPIFLQDTQAYDVVLSNQVWLQRNWQFRRYGKSNHFDYKSPRCDLDIEDSKPIFPHDTAPCDNTSPYHIW